MINGLVMTEKINFSISTLHCHLHYCQFSIKDAFSKFYGGLLFADLQAILPTGFAFTKL